MTPHAYRTLTSWPSHQWPHHPLRASPPPPAPHATPLTPHPSPSPLPLHCAEHPALLRSIEVACNNGLRCFTPYLLHRNTKIYELQSMNMATGALEPKEEAAWAQVLQALQPDQQQLQQLAACHIVFERKIQQVGGWPWAELR